MINKIKINDSELINKLRNGREVILKLNNENNISIKDIVKFEIQCCICKIYYLKRYKGVYFNKEYRCHKCTSIHFNGFKGKKHTQEFKNKLSRERKGKRPHNHNKSNYEWWVIKFGKEVADIKQESYINKLSNLLSGEKNPFYGKKHDKQTMEIIVNKTKKYRENMTDVQKLELREKFKLAQQKLKDKDLNKYIENKKKAGKVSHQKSYKYKMNKVEKMVDDYLKNIDNDFEYSVILDKYQFDFGSKKRKILIEVHGDYWHGNPNIYKTLNSVQQKNINRDIQKEEWCKKHNMTLIIIWENDIKNGNFAALDRLKDTKNEF